jgi:hypothetical protein
MLERLLTKCSYHLNGRNNPRNGYGKKQVEQAASTFVVIPQHSAGIRFCGCGAAVAVVVARLFVVIPHPERSRRARNLLCFAAPNLFFLRFLPKNRMSSPQIK